MQTRIRIISQFIGNLLYSTASPDDPQMDSDRRILVMTATKLLFERISINISLLYIIYLQLVFQ